jgi:UPF0716 protein FxsA
MKALVRLVDRAFLLKVLYLALFYSLVPIAEIVLILYLRPHLGNYLLLAAVVSTGLLGLGIAWRQTVKALGSLREQIKSGFYPADEFAYLAGALLGSLLLLTPGFITDILGLFFFLPVIKRSVGRVVTGKIDDRLKELYEYMKL